MSIPFADFLSSDGGMARLILTHDWSTTLLGPLDGWPQSLRTVTALVVRSPLPIVMLWGPDGMMIYNAAYIAFAGARHPGLLGNKVCDGWPEVADFNANVMRVGLSGRTLSYKDQELPLHRHGRPEQVWMNLDYSPVSDETGRPAGVIAIVVETTARIRAERRQPLPAQGGRFPLDFLGRKTQGDLVYASGRHLTAEKEQAAELAAAQEALRQSFFRCARWASL